MSIYTETWNEALVVVTKDDERTKLAIAAPMLVKALLRLEVKEGAWRDGHASGHGCSACGAPMFTRQHTHAETCPIDAALTSAGSRHAGEAGPGETGDGAMTTSFKGAWVAFEKEIREDDAEALISAIKHLRNVIAVEPSVDGSDDWINRERIRYELRKKIWDALDDTNKTKR